ncbi:hypothetical protein [Vibrio hyugaensis]|uniref:hypothetical protein n=1 Tax=Vibrio hyugaensis TaxID=1534743 RepID=UPI003D9FF175
MTSKKKRIIHSLEFKTSALKLAKKVAVAAAARLRRRTAIPVSENKSWLLK